MADEFWNTIITEKSWKILQELKKLPIKFIVIGGWAVWLWSRQQKSKDIDIVLMDFSDMDYLKKNYDLRKNDSLKKYEIKIEEIDIDIYVAFFSSLAIPAEEIKKYTAKIENFDVPIPELLLLLKQQAEIDRKESVKGEKDRIDILTILDKIDFKKYRELIEKYKKEKYSERLKEIIKNFKEYNKLNMNPRELKLFKQGILERIKKAGL